MLSIIAYFFRNLLNVPPKAYKASNNTDFKDPKKSNSANSEDKIYSESKNSSKSFYSKESVSKSCDSVSGSEDESTSHDQCSCCDKSQRTSDTSTTVDVSNDYRKPFPAKFDALQWNYMIVSLKII